jgi:alginate O-acetyltransferase complex protein AlgI
MLFDSPEYFYFFTVALLLYWSLRERGAARTVVVFGLSCIFYMAASPKFIVLMLGSTFLDSIVGRKIAAATDQSTKKRWLVLSIGANLLLLGTFKYWNFVATSTEDVAQLLGNPIDHPLLRIALPPGISFYTFESLSYVHRRLPTANMRAREDPSLELALLHQRSFPKLVAGSDRTSLGALAAGASGAAS